VTPRLIRQRMEWPGLVCSTWGKRTEQLQPCKILMVYLLVRRFFLDGGFSFQ
jgi:hypothetical protein